MLERALRECGMTTGFYTSPHLIDIRERFRVNGKVVSREIFNTLTDELRREAGNRRYSYFEFATVLAMKIFLNARCDIIIWETGMGGRLDATNMVTPEAAVITNIALDHQNHLGDTLARIAGEKAGIIKPGVPLFHGKLPPEAAAVIYECAEKSGCKIFPPRESVPPPASGSENCFTYDRRQIKLGLPGKMQRENFRIVYELLNYFAPRWQFDMDTALAALARVRWPARFQQVNSRLIVDGGHNPDGVAALAEAVKERCPEEKFTIVYAAFGDKHAENCLPYLIPLAKRFVFTSVGDHGRDVFTPEALTQMCGDIPAETAISPLEAMTTALRCPERVIVSGSLYLAGMILEQYAPESAFDL
jgi:dihydrofolate synthase/folylpolyglutamate synthase